MPSSSSPKPRRRAARPTATIRSSNSSRNVRSPCSTSIHLSPFEIPQASALWPVSAADAVARQRGFDHCGNLLVLADHDARRHLDLRHLGPEPREGLRQFRADRAAAQHDQPPGRIGAVSQLLPHRVGSQIPHLIKPRQRRNERRRARRDDDSPGGQPPASRPHPARPRRSRDRSVGHVLEAPRPLVRHSVRRCHAGRCRRSRHARAPSRGRRKTAAARASAHSDRHGASGARRGALLIRAFDGTQP